MRRTGYESIERLSHSGRIVVALLLVCLFLFQVGFVYEITGAVPSSLSLSIARRDVWPTYLDAAYTTRLDVGSAEWLSGKAAHGSLVYADSDNTHAVLTSYTLIPRQQLVVLPNSTPTLNEGQYVYLGSFNVLYGKLEMGYGFDNSSRLSPLLGEMNVVYSNGESQVYYFP